MLKIVLLASFLLFYNSSDCQNLNVVSSSDEIYKISHNTVFLEDKTGNKTLADVLSMPFSKAATEVPNFSISNSTFWIKFQIKNNTQSDDLIIDISHATLDSVTLFSMGNDKGMIDSILVTESKRYRHRPIDYQTYMFPAILAPGQQRTYFLKVKASEQILLPISVGSTKEVLKSASVKDLIFGIYIGIIIVMLLYNLFLSFSISNAGYLYYVIYIFFVGLTQAVLQGYSFRFLWPNMPLMNSYAGVGVPLLNGITAIEFVRHFLNLKGVSRKLDIGMRIVTIAYIAAGIPFLFGNYVFSQFLLQVVASGGSFYLFILLLILVARKYKPAKILLVAWSIFLLCVIIFVLRNFGILPYNNFTFYALQIGSSIEAILLSLALADKINTYRREQSIARKQALHISKENERLVKEQNIMLEKEVKARTSELQQTNRDLNETLQQLKLAQAKLVDSEKMASLGQLTAGVAHEINNPINFVTSNIKPLELDIKDIFDILKRYEDIDVKGNVESQLEAIDHYKKQLDTEFIAGEITSLLNGIREGADRTAAIVKNLKNFSRIDQSDLKYVNLNEGIESTLMLVRNSFPMNLKVQKQLGDIPMVECSPGKINQVFMNIITNAVQAIKAEQYNGGKAPTLTISSWQEGESVKVSIKDNGTGMKPEVVEKIYEPFFTTKGVGEGTGLGMSIVKGIMDNHDGNMEVVSAPGQGTEFILTLPQHSNRQ